MSLSVAWCDILHRNNTDVIQQVTLGDRPNDSYFPTGKMEFHLDREMGCCAKIILKPTVYNVQRQMTHIAKLKCVVIYRVYVRY